MTPRAATFLMFVAHGVIFGTWVASIPGVKTSLEATGAMFGLALMFVWLGALLAQQVTGQLLVRVSSRHVLTAAGLVFPLLFVLPLLAPTIPLLAASLFVFGYLNSTMDMSMNAHGVALEQQGGTSIMSGLHAGWSLGAAIGAIGVAIALSLEIEPLAEALLVGIVLWLLVLVASRSLGSGSVKTEGASGLHLPSRAVLPLAGLVVFIAFVMGGLTDWGGVYLDLGVGAEESLAALAYAAFSLGLFSGRIVGDWVKDQIGSIKLTQWGMWITAIAIAAFLLIGNPWVALVGMFVAGIGLANAVPQIFGAAGRIPPGGPSLSAVFMTMSLVFIISPALIGRSSDLFGISGVFWLFVVASVVAALLVPRVKVAETNPRFRAGD
jgi:predicted MFS family arabinose efflux permease